MTAFTEFALDRPIAPCEVTRDLIRRIEKLLIEAERHIMDGEAQNSSRRFDLSVMDSLGSETFQTAEDIPTSGFPETTHAVRFLIESNRETKDGEPRARSFVVKLVFRRKPGNRLTLKACSPQAREIALGLLERIRQLTEPHSLDSWVFRRREWLTSSAAYVAVFGGLIWVLMTFDVFLGKAETSPRAYAVWTSIVWTAAAYLFVLHFFFPKCAFETTRWAAIQEWRTWAKRGFASLIVFEVVVGMTWRHVAPVLGF